MAITETVRWLLLCAVTLGCSAWFGWELVGKLYAQLDPMVRLGTGILIGLSGLGILQTSVPLLRRLPLLTILILLLFSALLRIGVRSCRPSTLWENRPFMSFDSMHLTGILPRSLVIVGCAVFSISYVAGFPRLLGAAFILLGFACQFRARRSRRGKLIVSLVATSLLGLSELVRRHEPGWWLAVSNDATYFESLGWWLAQNGPRSHPALPEQSVFGYHYLAYAVSGALGEISGSPPYYVLNVILPLLLLTSLSLVLFPFLLRHSQSFVGATAFVIAYCSVLRVSSLTSMTFSNWAISIYVMLLLERHRVESASSRSTNQEVLLAIVAFIAVFGKATALPFAMVLGLCSVLASPLKLFSLRPQEVLRSSPWHLALPAVLFAPYYLQNSPDYSRQNEFSVLKTLLVLPNNEGLWQSRTGLVWISLFVVVVLLALEVRRRDVSREETIIIIINLLVWIPAVGAVLVTVAPNAVLRTYLAEHSYYVILHLVVLSASTRLTRLPRSINGLRFPAPYLFPSAIIGLSSYFAVFWAPKASQSLETFLQNPRSRWAYFVVANAEALLPTLLTIVALAFQLVSARKAPQTRPSSTIVFRALVVMSLSLSIANGVDHHSLTARNSAWRADFDASHPDVATSEVGNYLRDTTPADSIVASNSFCCRGTKWLADELIELRKFSKLLNHSNYGESAYGGANYQLVSVSRRQFLLAGPRFVVTKHNSDIVARRLEASVLFGSTGAERYGLQLRNEGANYFVVDKAALGDIPMPDFQEDTIFENSRYLVLNLNI